MPKHPNNRDRVAWAEEALKVYAKRTGLDLAIEREDAIVDLISDLLHNSHHNEIPAGRMLYRARSNFDAECKEDMADA